MSRAGVSAAPCVVIARDEEEWAAYAARCIASEIEQIVRAQGSCSLMLTGGRSAEALYRCWAGESILPLGRMRLLIGDERCVPPEHPDSNWGMVQRTLLARGVPPGGSAVRMEAEDSDPDRAARAYEQELRLPVDVALFGLGADGHIASLFPGGGALREAERRVVWVPAPRGSHARLTVTPPVVAAARHVFVLCAGADKGRVLARVLEPAGSELDLPARLVRRATWILDGAAAHALPSAVQTRAIAT